MRRRLLRIAICLVLGAITTIAVAWGCALDGYALSTEYERRDAIERLGPDRDIVWTVRQRRKLGELRIDSIIDHVGHAELHMPDLVARDLAPSWFLSEGPVHQRLDFRGTEVYRIASVLGWPIPAMWHELRWIHVPRKRAAVQVLGGIDTGRERRTLPVVLPVRVLCLRFSFNAVFFATIWALLLVAPGIIRLTLRRRRGRCPRCGYDLRGQLDAGCPECGWNRMEKGAGGSRDKGTEGVEE